MKLKPFKAWLLWDADGTYEGTLHYTRASAVSEKQDQSFLRDAKWRIARIEVRGAERRLSQRPSNAGERTRAFNRTKRDARRDGTNRHSGDEETR